MLEVLVGNSRLTYGVASIYINQNQCGNKELHPTQGKIYEKIKLDQPAIISQNPTELGLGISFGDYYHGYPKYRVKNLYVEDIAIKIDSNSFENGNNLIGGPIFGFVFSPFYINPNEI